MTDSETDLELLARWLDHDNRAGSVLVKRHFAALYRFFANKARGQEEDLIQQTFVACVESRDRFRGESSFRAFLFGLARHTLLTHYRRQYRRQQIDFTTTSVHDLATSPSGRVAREQEHELLEAALRRLPLDQQIALELTYREELTAPEVARALGIPENTVYTRLHRGKAHLRQALMCLDAEPTRHERALTLLTGGAEHEPAAQRVLLRPSSK
jgi:RNA polymerase sigma factor (sigma-70 family)